MTRQDPLPGVGGRARFGRRAAVSSREREKPSVAPGSLPLRYSVRIDPRQVLLNICVPGEPQAWERVVNTRAKISEKTGQLVQGHSFLPEATRNAEEMWRWIFCAYRVIKEPVPYPVAARAYFRTSSSRGDGSNFWKLIEDAGNGTLWADDVQVVDHHVHVARRHPEPGVDLLVWMVGHAVPELTVPPG